MTWLPAAMIGALSGAFSLSLVFIYLAVTEKRDYLKLWAIACIAAFFHYLIIAGAGISPASPLSIGLLQLTALLSGTFILWGSSLFKNRKMDVTLVVIAGILAVWTVLSIIFQFFFFIATTPLYLYWGAALAWTAWVLYDSMVTETLLPEKITLERLTTQASFGLLGLGTMLTPFFRLSAITASWGYLLLTLAEIVLAWAMMAVYLQKFRIELADNSERIPLLLRMVEFSVPESGLAENAERFHLFVEKSRDLVYLFNFQPEFQFTYVNPAYAQASGYSAAEFYEQSALEMDHIHPEDQEIFRQLAADSWPDHSMQIRLLHRDGSTVWTEQWLAPIVDEEGKVLFMMGLGRVVPAPAAAQAVSEVLTAEELPFVEERRTADEMAAAAETDALEELPAPDDMPTEAALTETAAPEGTHSSEELPEVGPAHARRAFKINRTAKAKTAAGALGQEYPQEGFGTADALYTAAALTPDHVSQQLAVTELGAAAIAPETAGIPEAADLPATNTMAEGLDSIEANIGQAAAERGSIADEPTAAIQTKTGGQTQDDRGVATAIPQADRIDAAIAPVSSAEVLETAQPPAESAQAEVETQSAAAIAAPASDAAAAENQDLPNRLAFREDLAAAIKNAGQGRKLAVLFLNLDSTHQISKLYDHHASEQIILGCAAGIRGLLRQDQLLASAGNNNLLALVPEVDSYLDVERLAEKLLAGLRQFTAANCDYTLLPLIGIAIYPLHGDQPDILMDNAELAASAGKKSLRQKFVVYDPSLRRGLGDNLRLQEDLRQALARDEFFLEYQAQFSLSPKQMLVGAEAQLRWRHPQKGVLMPDIFQAAMEEIGLSSQLGDWVLETACRQFKKWQQCGTASLQMAVNVFSGQFRHRDFAETVQSILQKTEVRPESLILEISKEIAFENVAQTQETLRKLRRIGVQVTMDNFGGDALTLYQLKDIPVKNIKINRDFLKDYASSSHVADILAIIVNLGSQLGLSTLAEGVEDHRQLDLLTKFGCLQAQGSLLAQPMSGKDFEIRFLICRRPA